MGKDEDIFKFVIRIRDKSNPISTISQEPRPEEPEREQRYLEVPTCLGSSELTCPPSRICNKKVEVNDVSKIGRRYSTDPRRKCHLAWLFKEKGNDQEKIQQLLLHTLQRIFRMARGPEEGAR